ncbi:S-adenosyl-L-methionine-dependent methyltransferase [Thelephora ganbajun]|uniref:S-adenosyl-L-methionine-dependent methyltransferase n=1 Tax=Thelephora ganbajun TaxID=370292 RepID=A0ACB6ZIF7_THEGA|nr:S-adenosyl-L-methionine-dependent methyltransferase [Thelephora ganbajun]
MREKWEYFEAARRGFCSCWLIWLKLSCILRHSVSPVLARYISILFPAKKMETLLVLLHHLPETLDDDDYLSDTSSILTEIDPSYPFPVDGREQNRMNEQHDLLKELLGGNYVGPVRDLLARRPLQRQIKVLDLCTGTGKWVVEMAEEFPHVKFNALDIVPISTRSPPRNVDFEVHDVTSIRFPDSSFDFVHARHCSLLPEIEYSTMLTEASRVLRPGGLILLGEWIHLPIDFQTGRSPPGVTAFCQALNSSLLSEYAIPNIPPYLTDYISQLGGFDDIQSRDYRMPIGDWGWSSPRAKALGFKFGRTLKIWAESAAMVIAKAGYGEDVVKGLLDGFKGEIFNIAGLQIAYRVVTARRLA